MAREVIRPQTLVATVDERSDTAHLTSLFWSQHWTPIDCNDVGHRPRGSVEDCRAFWLTFADSDKLLIRACFCLGPVCVQTSKKITYLAHILLDGNC